MTGRGRLTAYESVSTHLALCGDAELRELLDTAVPLGTGIGGKSARLDVSGTPVFKRESRKTSYPAERLRQLSP
jgi:hypothetical protein